MYLQFLDLDLLLVLADVDDLELAPVLGAPLQHAQELFLVRLHRGACDLKGFESTT